MLAMLAPDFRFSFLWAEGGEAREFAGSLDEYHGYLAQRRADGQLHHIDLGAREGAREVALGHTTRHGERLATFVFAVWLAPDGRAERLYAARTPAFADLDG